jgi:hypothetical protein
MRCIRVNADDVTIRLRFYFDGGPTDVDRGSVSCVGAEVIGDFPDHRFVEEELIRVDAPERVPDQPGWLTLYARREYSM